MPKETPITPDEKHHRIAIIQGLIADGLGKAEIVRRCQAEHAFGVTNRMVYYLIEDAYADLRATSPTVDPHAYYMLSVMQIDQQIGEAIAAKDRKSFNALMRTRMDLIKMAPLPVDRWEQDAIAAGIDPAEAQRQYALYLTNGVGNGTS